MAEGVFLQRLRERRLERLVAVASAGMNGYHVGESPDQRAQRAASKRGYDLSGIRARRFGRPDFDRFDLILAVDRANLEILRRLCPADRLPRLGLLMDYARNFDCADVPDPYFGMGQGFDLVLDMIEDAAAGLLEALAAKQAGSETSTG